MFLGLQWYWWLVIVAAVILAMPFKLRFMKRWSARQQEQNNNRHGKWGDGE